MDGRKCTFVFLNMVFVFKVMFIFKYLGLYKPFVILMLFIKRRKLKTDGINYDSHTVQYD